MNEAYEESHKQREETILKQRDLLEKEAQSAHERLIRDEPSTSNSATIDGRIVRTDCGPPAQLTSLLAAPLCGIHDEKGLHDDEENRHV